MGHGKFERIGNGKSACSERFASVTYVLGTLCNPMCPGRTPGFSGGGGGIRTPETLSSLTVFKTAGFNRSPTPPAIDSTHQ